MMAKRVCAIQCRRFHEQFRAYAARQLVVHDAAHFLEDAFFGVHLYALTESGQINCVQHMIFWSLINIHNLEKHTVR